MIPKWENKDMLHLKYDDKGEILMLKTVDVGLMANHLSVHNAIIKKLELYTSSTQNQQLIILIEQQIGLMKNHVSVMNNLLIPNQNTQVSLPPIPQMTSHSHANYSSIGLEDKAIAIDAYFTAIAMANGNFTSALNMKDPQVKNIHIEMALQQTQIADQISMLAEQNGWMSHPNATAMEQTHAQNPLKDGNQEHMPGYNHNPPNHSNEISH